MEEKITSRRNATVQEYRLVLRGKDPTRMVIEGPRLLGEALQAGLHLESALSIFPPPLSPAELEQLHAAEVPLHEVIRPVLEAATEARSPQACVALARIPHYDEEALFPTGHTPLIAVAAGVQNAGNLGAIARCSEAFGATGLITLTGSARLYRPGTLRGAMGSLFRLPALESLEPTDLLALCRRRGLAMLVCENRAARPFDEAPLDSPLVVVFGSEVHGIPPELRSGTTAALSIPMEPPVESLGVAAAAAVILHEIHRRRGA